MGVVQYIKRVGAVLFNGVGSGVPRGTARGTIGMGPFLLRLGGFGGGDCLADQRRGGGLQPGSWVSAGQVIAAATCAMEPCRLKYNRRRDLGPLGWCRWMLC